MKTNKHKSFEDSIKENTGPDGIIDFSKVEFPPFDFKGAVDIVDVTPSEDDIRRLEQFNRDAGH